MFYDNYLKICEENGVSPTRVLLDLGISKSAITNWKAGGEPLNETKKKIADYFGITVKQLMSGKIEKASEKSEAEDGELIEILEAVRRDPNKKILFSLTKNASSEDVKKCITIIKTICGDDNDGSGNY